MGKTATFPSRKTQAEKGLLSMMTPPTGGKLYLANASSINIAKHIHYHKWLHSMTCKPPALQNRRKIKTGRCCWWSSVLLRWGGPDVSLLPSWSGAKSSTDSELVVGKSGSKARCVTNHWLLIKSVWASRTGAVVQALHNLHFYWKQGGARKLSAPQRRMIKENSCDGA